jgi:sulfur carrier protein ThiS
VSVERFNLSQQPMAFAENPTVKAFLERSGAESLPLILLDGEFVLSGRYPTRQDLVRWFGIVEEKAGRALVKSCGGNTSCC